MSQGFKSAARITALVLAILFVSGWVAFHAMFGSPAIRVVNLSDQTIEDVRISDAGWERRIGTIGPKSEIEFIQSVNGESAPKVSFSVAGKVREEGLGYIEGHGGYCATITIHSDLRTTSETRLGCFSLRRGFRSS